jgi:hypothetical protein
MHSPGGEGDGGSIFWKTPAIGLASYNNLCKQLCKKYQIIRIHSIQPPPHLPPPPTWATALAMGPSDGFPGGSLAVNLQELAYTTVYSTHTGE